MTPKFIAKDPEEVKARMVAAGKAQVAKFKQATPATASTATPVAAQTTTSAPADKTVAMARNAYAGSRDDLSAGPKLWAELVAHCSTVETRGLSAEALAVVLHVRHHAGGVAAEDARGVKYAQQRGLNTLAKFFRE